MLLFPIVLMFIATTIATIASLARKHQRELAEQRRLLETALGDATEALAARDRLVSSVSHDLRTPLTSIVGYLDLAIEDPSLAPEVREQLDVASDNAERMLRLIADMLVAAKSTTGALPVALEPTDLSAIVREAARSLLPKARDRGIHIYCDANTSHVVNADAVRVRQVIDNVLSNAVNYGHDGGNVSVRVVQRDSETAVIVSDDGMGISAHDLPRVFDRFYRADAVQHASTSGSGLGLNISRAIMAEHGGELRIESDEGVGTTVTIAFDANPSV